jgi:hypothetical protein
VSTGDVRPHALQVDQDLAVRLGAGAVAAGAEEVDRELVMRAELRAAAPNETSKMSTTRRTAHELSSDCGIEVRDVPAVKVNAPVRAWNTASAENCQQLAEMLFMLIHDALNTAGLPGSASVLTPRSSGCLSA